MERPILFSTPMVRAILDDRKFKTRRIIKLPNWSTGDWKDFESDGNSAMVICRNTGCLAEIQPPYKVGDILWVRETWSFKDYNREHGEPEGYLYKADYYGDIEANKARLEGIQNGYGIWKWKPSIFMPRAAARLFLKLTGIRIERLQDISEEDAIQEGIPLSILNEFGRPIGWFKSLWDNINLKRGHGWEQNDWVRVISLERIQP